VAIKVMPADLTTDPQFRARFDREARAISQLQHPHICTLYDVGETGGTAYLVMELLQGQTLADRLEKGALPIDEALKIAIDVADALSAAHKQGIVHRDLKPANIMLTKAGAKLLDFGLAKAAAPVISMGAGSTQQTGTTHLTGRGTILGTLHYMSPEQIEGREADARSDIWAVGVVIYEMAGGTRPFDGDSGASIVSAILKDTPSVISAKQALAPPSLDHLVEQCLEKEPDDRWQNASDVRRELAWIARNTSRHTPVRPEADRPRRRLVGTVPWVLVAGLTAGMAFISLRTSAPSLSVIKLDLNMPPGVEVATTNNPNISISRDGQAIAFTGAVGGLRRVYLRRFEQSAATMLQGTDGANICVISPDGRAISFITTDRLLKRISIQDGLVTTVASDVDYYVGGGIWGPDDRIVFVRAGELWDVPAAGGAPRQLTRLETGKGEILHSWPIFLPDRGVVLFTVVTTGSRTQMHIEALTRATGERLRVVEDGGAPQYAASGHLFFFRGNALLATRFDAKTLTVTGQPASVLENIALDQLGMPMVAVSEAGVMAYVPNSATKRLVWVSGQGLEEPITNIPRPYQNPRLAPDGHRIVVEVAGGDLWIQDASRSTFTRMTTSETVGNTFAVWTPNGQHAIFRTVTGLWSVNTDGSGGLHHIPETSVADLPTSVSPDGGTLAFIRQTSDTAGDIYTLSLDGPPNPVSVVKTPGYDGGAVFSPDGRWMAYVTNESGQREVYVRPTTGPDRRLPVSTGGGTHPRWNPNGKELFYRNGKKMMVVDVSIRSGDILLLPRLLFEQRYDFGSALTVANYDVSPDGQRFVMVKDDSDAGRLNVVLHWFEDVEGRVPLR
jgi:serine/threonine-protein kinase